ncbi:hypothetical protein BVC93_04395 [Mycobacterium sp. MS1601]|uniref:hypothetical protein n=1 Tax=Mycobacterium sp. MS1601 TaxID=1936029 RepID=UPI00097958C2|nr:hypothetical protein [Mycobacterium sp. MS1601]AQA01802.1 hypothetical protein BVC93_04395 [Mycobacterium sp. MS1601]
MSVKSLVAATPSGRSRALLIDDAEYSTAVIRQGEPIPWADTTALVGHFGQVRGLLDPDALWVDLRRLQAAHLAARPDLVTAMAARTRTGYPLRTLLCDDDLMSATVDALATVAGTSRRELVLAIPSPAVWLTWAHDIAGNPLDGVDEDRADSASMYLAEWLGRLGSVAVALVLLDAREQAAGTPERLDAYTAIANVASHFGWSLALRHTAGFETAPGDPEIAVLPGEFWTGEAEVPDAEVLVSTIPAAAAPERVLDRLAALA